MYWGGCSLPRGAAFGITQLLAALSSLVVFIWLKTESRPMLIVFVLNLGDVVPMSQAFSLPLYVIAFSQGAALG